MPKMFYCPMCMTIEWDGLSIPTDRCSEGVPIRFVNSKFWGAKQDFAPYMVKVILAHITVECAVVDPYVDGFFDGSG